MRRYLFVSAAAVLVAAAGFIPFTEARAEVEVKQLKLGDPAPKLDIGEWIQGGPVTVASEADKKVRVVEFWATWCPPCRESIPHLNELYKKYRDKGLDLVAITSEDPEHVKSFVKERGDKMVYPVAVDKDFMTATAYMLGFNQEYIPYAFVVDTNGKIVWHGYPLDEELVTVIEKNLPKREAQSTSDRPDPNA